MTLQVFLDESAEQGAKKFPASREIGSAVQDMREPQIIPL